MHNALYHINKIKTVDLEQLDKYDNVVGYHETREYDIELDFVKEITNQFSRLGDYYPSVVNYLVSLGIVNSPRLPEDKSKLNEKTLEGIISFVIWELFERERNNG